MFVSVICVPRRLGATLFAVLIVLSVTTPLALAQQIEKQKLLASNGHPGDEFGYSVAISDDVAVLGARHTDGYGNNAGSAYVFRNTGGVWEEKQQLFSSDIEDGDEFGYSVAISDDVAVVGARLDDDMGGSSGSAYVFRFNGLNWDEEQKLVPHDGATTDWFGYSVAISDNIVVVGAPQNDAIGNYSGAAYVFRFNGISWIEEQKILPTIGMAGEQFGNSVSVSGNVLAIGAWMYEDNVSNARTGAAYMFRFNGNAWGQEQKLLAHDGMNDDLFGYAISMSGDVVVVGAPNHNDSGLVRSGASYVYRLSGANTWVLEQEIVPSDGSADDWFGASVSISEGLAVIGSLYRDAAGTDSGAAYAYRFNGNSWVEERKLLASDGMTGDLLGNSVATDGDTAIAGAWGRGDKGTNSGAAYTFDVAPSFYVAVSPDPTQSGQLATFQANNGFGSQQIWLVYSFAGEDCTTFHPQLNVIFSICDPANQWGNPISTGFTNSYGSIEWDLQMPAVGIEIPVWFQAVQLNNITPVLATTILP